MALTGFLDVELTRQALVCGEGKESPKKVSNISGVSEE